MYNDELREKMWKDYKRAIDEELVYRFEYRPGVYVEYIQDRLAIRMESQYIPSEVMANGKYRDVLPSMARKEIRDQDDILFGGGNYNYYLAKEMLESGHEDWLKKIDMSTEASRFEWVCRYNLEEDRSDICSKEDIYMLADMVSFISNWWEGFLAHPESYYYEDMLTPGILGVVKEPSRDKSKCIKFFLEETRKSRREKEEDADE